MATTKKTTKKTTTRTTKKKTTRRGKPSGVGTFLDDVVIHVSETETKLLKRTELDKLPDVPDVLMPVVETLLQHGVVLAAVPSSPGIGASCYLVNLRSIIRPK
ncbi:MAG: hypothetical protein JW751_02630 [Polyangiaceae bacterium]|nr:hypothetical protein [Polyangiaceae bacterium]